MRFQTSQRANPSLKEGSLPQLKVSRVDRVASFLLSSFIMVSALVCFLGAAFLLSKIQPSDGENQGSNPRGGTKGSEYVSTQNQRNELAEFPDSEDWKDAVSDQALDAVNMVSLVEENVSLVSEAYDGNEKKGGSNDSREEANQGEGDESFSVPSGTRWELKFSAKDRKSYAKQLESLGIELGVYGAGRPIVEYASDLTRSTPTYRRGSPSTESRPFFVSVSHGILKEFDQQLLRLAGIDLMGRQPIKFLSKQAEEQLVELEVAHAQSKMGVSFPKKRILRTVFECRPNANGNVFDIVVVSQRYKTN